MEKILINNEICWVDTKKPLTKDELSSFYESIRVNEINNKTESIIVAPYPIYKQLNIRGLLSPFTLQDIEVMDMFIDSVRGIGREAKDTGLTVDKINWGGLDKYTSHDEIMKDATQIKEIRERLGF